MDKLRGPDPERQREAAHAWLATRVPGWPADAGHWHAERLAGGQSNPTWRLSVKGAGPRWVLRAKPGPAATLLPSAHAIEREFRVLRALAGSAVPVPEALALCEDESLIGAAFYVMQHVSGRELRDARLPGLPAAQRAHVHEEAIRVLAALHRVDWLGCGLDGFGRTDQISERLITRWTRQYRASTVGGTDACAGASSMCPPLPAMERLIDWLPAHVPPPEAVPGVPAVALTHGDYRLENLIFHARDNRVAAVLDWELSTLGHPLSDLAYHAMSWHVPAGLLRGLGEAPTWPEGTPSLHQYIERYFEHLFPHDAPQAAAALAALQPHWPFYLACNLFRLAAILQGIGARLGAGQAVGPHAAEMARMAGPVAALGWAVASGERAAW